MKNDDIICYMNETPITLNMPLNYVISQKKKKTVIKQKQLQKKYRVSVMLGIMEDDQTSSIFNFQRFKKKIIKQKH